jgi:hypothetical protein
MASTAGRPEGALLFTSPGKGEAPAFSSCLNIDLSIREASSFHCDTGSRRWRRRPLLRKMIEVFSENSVLSDKDYRTTQADRQSSIRRFIMDKLINLFNQYYDRMMDWYHALAFLEQMGVLFGLFVLLFGIVALYIIRK